MPKYVELTPETNRDVKILFLLQLNGRNSRQIKRLLKIIYNPKHLYLVHVDIRQSFMHAEMREVQELLEAQGYKNFRVMEDRFATIWGGSSLLDMFLHVINQTLSDEIFGSWDYIFNLSESDFPILSLAELEAILAANKGKSFVSAHGYNTGTFLKKQGYNFVFFECENRMWRLGPRNNYPNNIRMDGGSDWVIIHRDLAKFSITNEPICVQMRQIFNTMLLPLEGFFHTLALNTKFCNSLMHKNLRLTNWKRDQGCRCDALKHVVDWCGCSPVVILHDEGKLTVETLQKRVNYFARKLESLIDVMSVAEAEKNALRFEPNRIQVSHSFTCVWVNFFDARFDQDRPDAREIARVAKHFYHAIDSSPKCEFDHVIQVNAFRAHIDDDYYAVILFEDKCGGRHEVRLRRSEISNVVDTAELDGYHLSYFEHGLGLDLKEEIFRDFLSLSFNDTKVTIQWQWKDTKTRDKNWKRTSPKVRYQLFDDEKRLYAADVIQPYNSIYHLQHIELDLKSRMMRNGRGRFILSNPQTHDLLGHLDFAVLPREDGELYAKILNDFYELVDHCSNDTCLNSYWSSLSPDLKAQISYGFNVTLNSLQ